MVTKLDRPVRREVRIGQTPYVVTIAPDKLRIAVKGRRKGQEALWEELVGAHDAPLAPLPPDGAGASTEGRRPRSATRQPQPQRGA